MTKDDIQLLYEYGRWANNRFASVSALTHRRTVHARSGRQLRFRARHARAHHRRGWLAYWKEPSPSSAFLTALRTRRDALFHPDAFPNIAAVQLKWAEVEKEQSWSEPSLVLAKVESL